MEENVKKQLDQLGNIIDEKIEKASEQVQTRADGKIEETLKGEINNLTQKFNERMDEMEVSNKKSFESLNTQRESKSFKSGLIKAINDGALDSLRKGNSRAASFEVKADMTVAADFTGEVIPAQRVPGYYHDPNRPQNIRQMLPIGSTNSDVVRYVEESGYSKGAGATAEGATFEQTDLEGEGWRIGPLLADTPQLSSYISNRVPAKLMEVEDDQLLGGSGVAPNLKGLLNSSSDFDESTNAKFYQAVTAPNEFDVLVAAINHMALNNYRPNYILLNPTDFHKILLTKDTTNNYIKDQVYQGLAPSFMGVPVVQNVNMTAGKFLVGDFANSCQVWVRDNVSIEFFSQDGTNVRDGFVTVRAVERVALATYLPNGIIYGTFSSAITSMTAS